MTNNLLLCKHCKMEAMVDTYSVRCSDPDCPSKEYKFKPDNPNSLRMAIMHWNKANTVLLDGLSKKPRFPYDSPYFRPNTK